MRSKVELFYDERFLNITITEDNIETWNLPMNENRFKLFKNSTSIIQFIVRNNDRKPINLIGKELFITINDEFNSKTLLHKRLQIVNPKMGQVKLVTHPEEVKCFPIARLTFNVSIIEDGHLRLLHLDQAETARGFLDVQEGTWIGPKPTQMCRVFSPVLQVTNPPTYRFFSTPFAGPAQVSNVEGLQTISINASNYTGKISIYGSLETAVPTNTSYDWFPISINDETTYDYVDQKTGVLYYSFKCVAMWIMVVFDPDVPYNENNQIIDTIVNVLYKN